MDWVVWGLGREPVFEGTETEVKAYVVARPSEESADLYIASPDGREFSYDEPTGKWREE